jgi:hypothetical protein
MFGIFKYCYDVIKRQRIPKGKSQMDNPEKLTTYGTQDEDTYKRCYVVFTSSFSRTAHVFVFAYT